MDHILDFEKPVSEIEDKICELKAASKGQDIDISKEIEALQKKADRMIREIYSSLTPWERVQLSRHPARPHAVDFIKALIGDFHEVHGDRRFQDDRAMICGFGRMGDFPVAVVAIEKGRNTKEKITHNFGMPNPEGYRKALRVMELAARFSIPIISFVDTPGAYPGIEAEKRGQSQAIAENLQEMFGLKTPIVAVIIGEGGSGGALGVAVADRAYMMEYSIYSVISPESCASILWADPKRAKEAANSLKLGPLKAYEWGVIDGIIPEPLGGAHKNPEESFRVVEEYLKKSLESLKKIDGELLLQKRFEKFRNMGRAALSEDTD
ncbi:MAG: acetyl-CoA carboxylase carboxyltransferase subunit alpha [Bacteriovoracales bacterium]|nr:acetyl-CoA carboxylase carboxyltransferase subunit alpha [Bacteriovoracales bacterium]